MNMSDINIQNTEIIGIPLKDSDFEKNSILPNYNISNSFSYNSENVIDKTLIIFKKIETNKPNPQNVNKVYIFYDKTTKIYDTQLIFTIFTFDLTNLRNLNEVNKVLDTYSLTCRLNNMHRLNIIVDIKNYCHPDLINNRDSYIINLIWFSNPLINCKEYMIIHIKKKTKIIHLYIPPHIIKFVDLYCKYCINLFFSSKIHDNENINNNLSEYINKLSSNHESIIILSLENYKRNLISINYFNVVNIVFDGNTSNKIDTTPLVRRNNINAIIFKYKYILSIIGSYILKIRTLSTSSINNNLKNISVDSGEFHNYINKVFIDTYNPYANIQDNLNKSIFPKILNVFVNSTNDVKYQGHIDKMSNNFEMSIENDSELESKSILCIIWDFIFKNHIFKKTLYLVNLFNNTNREETLEIERLLSMLGVDINFTEFSYEKIMDIKYIKDEIEKLISTENITNFNNFIAKYNQKKIKYNQTIGQKKEYYKNLDSYDHINFAEYYKLIDLIFNISEKFNLDLSDLIKYANYFALYFYNLKIKYISTTYREYINNYYKFVISIISKEYIKSLQPELKNKFATNFLKIMIMFYTNNYIYFNTNKNYSIDCNTYLKTFYTDALLFVLRYIICWDRNYYVYCFSYLYNSTNYYVFKLRNNKNYKINKDLESEENTENYIIGTFLDYNILETYNYSFEIPIHLIIICSFKINYLDSSNLSAGLSTKILVELNYINSKIKNHIEIYNEFLNKITQIKQVAKFINFNKYLFCSEINDELNNRYKNGIFPIIDMLTLTSISNYTLKESTTKPSFIKFEIIDFVSPLPVDFSSHLTNYHTQDIHNNSSLELSKISDFFMSDEYSSVNSPRIADSFFLERI